MFYTRIDRNNPIGFFSVKLGLAMRDAGLSASALAQRIGCSYAHIRKLLNARAAFEVAFSKTIPTAFDGTGRDD